eukprot:m.1633023 g.1633023  ORF g.1633023 m.1633023 type:complete len:77 (+) comp25406_c0_seq19:9982-10212(+)
MQTFCQEFSTAKLIIEAACFVSCATTLAKYGYFDLSESEGLVAACDMHGTFAFSHSGDSNKADLLYPGPMIAFTPL